MPKAVLDLVDARPAWRMTAAARARIRAAFPADWELIELEEPTDGRGDGSAGASAAALAAVRGAEVYFGFGVPPEILEAGAALRWVHSGTAGVRGSLTPAMLRSQAVFTNSAGIHAVPVAETVIGMMLHFARGLDYAVRSAAERRWAKQRFDAADSPITELSRSTVGIFGFGGIGREVARRARAFGARVLAHKRRRTAPPPGVELLYGAAGFARLLESADYLVLTAPETPQTERAIDAAALARMRPGSVLINIARGGLVDEPALIDALRAGRLRGAALDVFATEPLPASSPLWSLPGVLPTPHVSAYSPGFWEREAELIGDNVGRFLAGRPLRNVVDKQAGY